MVVFSAETLTACLQYAKKWDTTIQQTTHFFFSLSLSHHHSSFDQSPPYFLNSVVRTSSSHCLVGDIRFLFFFLARLLSLSLSLSRRLDEKNILDIVMLLMRTTFIDGMIKLPTSFFLNMHSLLHHFSPSS
jgi:hypothetical protein